MYLAQDLQDAMLLMDRLGERGIRCRIRNGDLHGALGELPLSVRPEVIVLDDRDYGAARQCVDEMEQASRASPVDEVVCPRCHEENPGNFELCWSCQADLSS